MTDTATLAPVAYPRIPRTFKLKATDSDTVRGELPEDHSQLYAGTIRTGSVRQLGDALAAIAVRIAKRIPGVELHYFSDDLGPTNFCTTHRELAGCSYHRLPGAAACHTIQVPATYITVTATGLPVFDSRWSVGGILATDSQGVTTATTVAGLEDGWASEHVDLAGTCAHCSTKRTRRVTVLLTSDIGRVKAVGRSCLGDYTGGSIRVEILAELIRLRERIATEFGVIAGGTPDEAPVIDVVACAIKLVARFGFTSKMNATRTTPSTAERLRKCIVPFEGELSDVYPAELTDDDREDARTAILTVQASDDASDYIANLKAIIEREWCQVTGRGGKLGMLASLPGAATRQVERERRDAERAAAKADALTRNEFAGLPGERVEITGRLATIREITNYFGGRETVSYLMVVEHDCGAVKWFTTARALVELEVGAVITVAATVKENETYEGRNTSLLARPKLIGVHAQA